jgi:hypothetical protein
MPKLPLPVLIVGQRQGEDILRMESTGTPGYAASFSTLTRASEFVQAAGESAWEFTLITRPAMPQLIADLIRQGLLGLCHDQDASGSGGLVFTLEELTQQFASPRAIT